MKLAGLSVVDLSQFMPGPMLATTLADHGAQVIKIESLTGDWTRGNAATPDDFFVAVNRGKRSIALDLKQPAGKEIAIRLIKEADVVLESWRPGVAARLGLDYETVKALNPRIVYCSLTAFGQSGPLAQVPAHDAVIQAYAGTLQSDQAGNVLPPDVSVAALSGSFAALAGILMALLRARETGAGDWIDLSIHDAALTIQPHLVGAALRARSNATQDAAQFSPQHGFAMLETYQTADGKWLCLGGRERHFSANLLMPLGRPELIDMATGPGGACQQPLRNFLIETFATRTLAEWMEWFSGRDISFAPVLSLPEALDHPQVTARGMLLADANSYEHVNTAIRFANEPARPDLRTPNLGEDTSAIMMELGYEASHIAALAGQGVIHITP